MPKIKDCSNCKYENDSNPLCNECFSNWLNDDKGFTRWEKSTKVKITKSQEQNREFALLLANKIANCVLNKVHGEIIKIESRIMRINAIVLNELKYKYQKSQHKNKKLNS